MERSATTRARGGGGARGAQGARRGEERGDAASEAGQALEEARPEGDGREAGRDAAAGAGGSGRGRRPDLPAEEVAREAIIGQSPEAGRGAEAGEKVGQAGGAEAIGGQAGRQVGEEDDCCEEAAIREAGGRREAARRREAESSAEEECISTKSILMWAHASERASAQEAEAGIRNPSVSIATLDCGAAAPRCALVSPPQRRVFGAADWIHHLYHVLGLC